MTSDKKKRKITSGEGFTLGADETLNLSIGDLFRREDEKKSSFSAVSKEKTHKEVKKHNEKESESGISHLSRVSLQRQTAGRRGKTVTLVIIPKNSKVDREKLAREMRKGLGCGSFIEGTNVILQGDLSDRAREWLFMKGVKEVIFGN